MVLPAAGDISIDVPVLLKASRDPSRCECLERAKDGRTADAWLTPAQPLVEILRSHLAADGGEGVRDEEALSGHALTGLAQPVGGRVHAQCPPTALAKSENA